jgi:hypothetical protein
MILASKGLQESLWFFQSCFWCSLLQYDTCLQALHLLDAGTEHTLQTFPGIAQQSLKYSECRKCVNEIVEGLWGTENLSVKGFSGKDTQ